VHFSARQIRADRLGAVTRYSAAHYAAPALPPPVPRLTAAPPQRPAVTGVRRTGETFTVAFTAPAGATSWALYDGAGALVATGRAGAAAPTAAGPPGTYCLTVLDRSANEGPPAAFVSP
jgi:hypothetical protein